MIGSILASYFWACPYHDHVCIAFWHHGSPCVHLPHCMLPTVAKSVTCHQCFLSLLSAALLPAARCLLPVRPCLAAKFNLPLPRPPHHPVYLLPAAMLVGQPADHTTSAVLHCESACSKRVVPVVTSCILQPSKAAVPPSPPSPQPSLQRCSQLACASAG